MRHKDLIYRIKSWMLLGLITAVFVVSCFTTHAQAGAYIDVGFSYISELGIVQSASINLDDRYTISAELHTAIDVDQWAGMFRLGYMWNSGIAVEYDTVGTPEYYLDRVNVYYRYEF